MNNNPNTDLTTHPTQGSINRIQAIVGTITAFILSLLTFLSLFLVYSSAVAISEIWGVISLFFATIVMFMLAYLSYLIKNLKIMIPTASGSKRPLDSFTLTLLHLLLILCGFVQTFFWVIDPENAIHEPRSVFILAIAGIFAYLRYQYSERGQRQTQSNAD
ncbi:MAG: hypothetical protein SFZ02_13045 [bacterium]|nr:hypothetical protein [bacterium]